MSRKDEIITGLGTARRKILDVISELPPEKMDEVFLGTWSLKDLLAHLIGWDYSNIAAVKDIHHGEPPNVFERWDPDWVIYNAELVREHKREDLSELLQSIEKSHNALVEFVRALPAEDIQKDFGVRSPDESAITVEWLLQFEIDDEERHYQQIRDWLE